MGIVSDLFLKRREIWGNIPGVARKHFKRLEIEETMLGTPHQGPHFPFPFQELPQDPDYQVPHGHLLICNVLTSQKEDWLEISNE